MEKETARGLIELLARHGTQVNEDIPNAHLTLMWVNAGWDTDRMEQALVGAGRQAWIDNGSRPGTFRLTEAGHHAARGGN